MPPVLSVLSIVIKSKVMISFVVVYLLQQALIFKKVSLSCYTITNKLHYLYTSMNSFDTLKSLALALQNILRHPV
jgi:hypothetical protein